MSNVIYFNTYQLVDGASVPDFLLALEKLIKESISKQKGFVSFKLLAEDDAWADYCMFETMDDLHAFLDSAQNSESVLAEKFYSFLNFSTCSSHIYTVEMSS